MAVVNGSSSHFSLHFDTKAFLDPALVTTTPTVAVADGTHLREALPGPAAPGPIVIDNYGSGFRYDGVDENGQPYPVQGTLTQVDVYFNGYPMHSVTGLAADWAGLRLADGDTAFNAILLAGNDTITLSPFDDVFAGFAGNDTLRGGAGRDTAVYTSNHGHYAFMRWDTGDYVWGPEGTDVLSGFERVQFADSGIALDLSPAGNAALALQAISTVAYTAMWSPEVVGMVMRQFDAGASTTQVFQWAIDAGHIEDLAGSASDIALVRLVMRNITGVTPTIAEAGAIAAQYLDTSGGTMTRAEALAFASQLDANVAHANLVGWAETGVPYI